MSVVSVRRKNLAEAMYANESAKSLEARRKNKMENLIGKGLTERDARSLSEKYVTNYSKDKLNK